MEIEKDLRLPSFASSWFMVASALKSADENHFERLNAARSPVRVVHWEGMTPICENRPEEEIYEYFEADEPTVKMRAFDELLEVIPDRDSLIKMRVIAMHSFGPYSSEENLLNHPILKLLDNLIELAT